MRPISITLETSQLEISLLNDVVYQNMEDISVAFDVAHSEISALNDSALRKRARMSVTLDTSHSDIEPCLNCGQSPSGDSSRHFIMASKRSTLSRTEKTRVIVSGESGMRVQTSRGESAKALPNWESCVKSSFNCDCVAPDCGCGAPSNMRSLLAIESTQAFPHSC